MKKAEIVQTQDMHTIYESLEGARMLLEAFIENMDRRNYVVTDDDLKEACSGIIEAMDILEQYR